jgi:hypothetical protein
MSPTPDRIVHTYAMQGGLSRFPDTLEKDTDPDIPIFIAAKSDYAKLQ